MRLHCLGTAGYHPNPTRHTSCYFLPESGVLLDAGTGVFRLAPLIETNTIDILLSHAHLDHICGLTFLLDVFHQRPIERLRIWGEQAKLDAIQTHLFSDLIFPVALDAQWIAIDDMETLEIGGASVTWRPQDHPGGSVAYRLNWNSGDRAKSKSLTYMTDTTGDTSEEAIAWCRGTDLLMHECYFDDSMADWAEKTGHSWTSRVVEITSAAKPSQLLVTHVNPLIPDHESKNEFEGQCDLIRQRSGVSVTLAEDELAVDF